MASRIFLLATVSCLIAMSSGSFFLLRQPNRSSSSSSNSNNQNTYALPSSFGNPFISRDNNNNVNAINSQQEETTTEKPFVIGANERCVQRSARDFRSHPQDCTKFTMCSAGTLLTIDCPTNSVFHEDSKSCVAKNSYYDTCTRRMATQLICPRGATHKKVHPTECAQYYHCGEPAQETRWETHLKECPYPMLFNGETDRCEHHSMVRCNERNEPVDPCEYKANNCDGRAQCVPCQVRHPSCRGKKDGMNAWTGREGSPYFVVCSEERVVYNGMCAQENGVQIFDHQSRICKIMEGGPW